MKENNLQNQKANQNQKNNTDQGANQAPHKNQNPGAGAHQTSRDSQFNQGQAGRQQQQNNKK